ncbi:myogenesis-regulating glycosidase-like [Diaphorina citri]|uniref:Myogenesis-regulating glycosidase-like n=1 Tax=Diaphorina citri TaxID=121845 RepID=A0A1S4EG49_DIACI|nr:myogenesis-regulating glycosidase-like [Diaphorina citri]
MLTKQDAPLLRRDIPDVKMIEHPIWTTWAKYKVDIDENKLLQYAQSIKDHGFKASQLEIDDNWEVCYGSAVINTTRFPNMKRTISQLNSLGFRTTMWVHPFVNNNCEPYYTRFKEMDILVNNLTHHYGTQWYVNRLKTLQKEIGLDSYKFDAGESSFAPQVPKLNCPEHEHPRCLTKAYVEAASKLGPLIEFRTGTQTQYLPNYIRMLDR